MRRLAGAAATLALAVGAAACSVGPERGPARIAADDVPFGLLDPERTAPTAPAAGSDGSVIYVVTDDDTLVPVARPDVDGVDGLVEQLRLPVREGEQQLELRSPLGDADAPVLRDAQLAGGLLTVDLTAGFAALDSTSQRLAIAQAVLSFTELPGIGQVTFTIDGRPVDVPRADGSLSGAPLARDDYTDLIQPP